MYCEVDDAQLDRARFGSGDARRGAGALSVRLFVSGGTKELDMMYDGGIHGYIEFGKEGGRRSPMSRGSVDLITFRLLTHIARASNASELMISCHRFALLPLRDPLDGGSSTLTAVRDLFPPFLDWSSSSSFPAMFSTRRTVSLSLPSPDTPLAP